MTKILIIGGSGFLGRNMCNDLKNDFDITLTFNKNPIKIEGCESIKLNVLDKNKITKTIFSQNPDYLFHLPALLVEDSEKNKNIAYKINYESVITAVKACNQQKIKLFFPSSAYIFDGKKGMYKEGDKPNPINFYGETKALAEKFITNNSDDYLIFRLASSYGPNDRRLNWLFKLAKTKKTLKAYSNNYISPISTIHITKALAKAIEEGTSGLFNVADNDRASRFEFFVTVAEVFNLDLKIVPVKYKEIENGKLPLDASLDNTEAKKEFGEDLFTDLKTGLKEIKKLYQ